MGLNFRQIEVFRAIMITGSIKGASKLLYVSQPAISRLMSYTEQKLKIKLFERIKGRLFPTPEAHVLFDKINVAYKEIQQVNYVLEDLVNNRSGILRISSNPTLGLNLIPQAIKKFNSKFPEIRIIFHTLLPEMMLSSILSQKVELGITFGYEFHPNINFQELYNSKLVVAIPANYPDGKKKEFSIQNLQNKSIITYGSDSSFGQIILNLLSDNEIKVFNKIEVQQIHVACEFVQAGVGMAFVDELTANNYIGDNVIFRPMDVSVDMPISIISGMYYPLSRQALAFIDILKNSVEENMNK